MKVTSLLAKDDAMLEQDIELTRQEVAKYSSQWFGRRPKKATDVIDAEIVGLAKWKKIAASWVIRVGRCIKATDPAIPVIVFAGAILALLTTVLSFEHMPTFTEVIIKGMLRWTECIVFGLALLYGIWEIVQGWKWITKWSERIKREENYEKGTNIETRKR